MPFNQIDGWQRVGTSVDGAAKPVASAQLVHRRGFWPEAIALRAVAWNN